MSSSAERLRRSVRVLVAGVVVLAAGLVAAPAASADEVYPRPAGRTIEFLGHGWGHGNGMSQYGALGGAQAGATWQQIVAKYYTGTTVGSIPNPTLRVRVASLGSTVQALPAAGLRVTWDLSASAELARTTSGGSTITMWRLAPATKVSGTRTRFRLEYQAAGSSTWRLWSTATVPGTAAFLNPTSGTVTTLRGSTQVVYRGQVRGTLIGSAGAESLVPVVALPMEDYLLSVVPNESPASWPSAALSAQAVAARSFAEYHRQFLPIDRAWYDVYDDTRSQVFPGTRVGGSAKEYASSSAAVRATAGRVLLYGGQVVYAQFSSSSGGWTNTGSKPYLAAVADPWDAVSSNPNHTWHTTVAISTIEAAYPSVGRLQALRITSRTGLGAEGGRVLGITVQGASGSVATTGTSFASRVGLKHHWFTPQVPASSPSYPRDVTGDGRADLLAVESSGGALRVYPSNGTGGWKAPIVQGSGFTAFPKVLTAGTWDAGPVSDLLLQDTSGRLFLRPGTGTGTFGTARQIGSGWTVHNLVVPVGDWDGDGATDLLARRASDGRLFLYRGNGTGGFVPGTGSEIGTGWNIFDAVLSPGDLDGDGAPDLLARTPAGVTYLYRGNGAGGWKLPRSTVATGWQRYTALTAIGDFTGDGRNDVLGRTADGRLWVLPGNGAGGVTAPRQVGTGWNMFSRLLL
ncbi:SpoIID/LytB domain-containing protein [Phycicoccus avicenniae]|uniref:SpoIID/LytB domain-containing protein n=1 Tax=Phycicoccus avicenniae TaxID=2828860 RepID=UPI003D2C01F1